MENKQELKKCPFCGGRAIMFEHKERYDESKIYKVEIWCINHCVSRCKKTLISAIQAWNTRAKQVDERQELDRTKVKAEVKNAFDSYSYFETDWYNSADRSKLPDLNIESWIADQIVNTFKPKVEKKSIKELQDKLVKFFSIESLTLNESTIVHLVAMISQHSYYADKPKVEETSKISIIRAYIEGYQIGHNDTVESCYGGWEDKAEEYFEEAPKINKEGTQNANT